MCKSAAAALVAALVAALGMAPAAQAQFGQPPSAEVIAAGQSFVPPKIPSWYASSLAEQPNFQGQWNHLGPVFDPQNYVEPYKSPPGFIDFGPSPGSYLSAVPYKPEYKQKYMQAVADTLKGVNTDTFALCKPYGMPRFMGGAGGFDLLQSPDLVVMQNAYGNETRRIFLDGRPHPSPVGAEGSDARTYTGHSVGRWEQNTLVIDTVNIVAGYYDDTTAEHSDQIRVAERIKLIGPNLMEVKLTIDDPVMFTKPWEVTQYYNRSPVSPFQNQPGNATLPTPPAAGGPPAAGTPGGGRPPSYTFHNLLDLPCQETIDNSKGYQSLILPQELDAKQERGGAEKTRSSGR